MNQLPVLISGRRRIALLLFALATLMILFGCTTGRGGSQSDAPDTLRIRSATEPRTLDPAVIVDADTGELLQNCCEGLIRINANNQPEPALAEKWDVSPDGMTYTFHIRKGVTFHNGKPVTAADVKYSWERALSPQTKSPTAVNYLDGVLGIKNLSPDKPATLPGVVVVDDSTLKVTLDHPRAYFPGMVAYPSNSVLCKAEVEANGGMVNEKNLGKAGTGPYIFDKYTPGQSVAFKANPNYWGGAAKMGRLIYSIIINPQTAYDDFRASKLDITSPSLQEYAQDRQNAALASQYHLKPIAGVTYLVMQRVPQPLFAKTDVRKAFAFAIDRDSLIRVAYKGVGQRADGFIPPQLQNGQSGPPAIPYDPAQAQALLSKAGFPDGKGFPTLTLTYVQGVDVNSKTAEMVRNNLKDNLGITVNLQEREAGQFYQDEEAGRMSFYLIGWYADYPDAQDFLSTLFVTGVSQNHAKYSNPRFDALCQQADAESAPARRGPLYAAADKILMQDVGALPIAFPPRIFLVRPSVQNWRVNLCSRLPDTLTTK